MITESRQRENFSQENKIRGAFKGKWSRKEILIGGAQELFKNLLSQYQSLEKADTGTSKGLLSQSSSKRGRS